MDGIRLLAWRASVLVWPMFASPLPSAAEIRSLPVPAAAIYPNDIISNATLAERRFQVTPASLSGFARSRGELIGRQARRRLAAGKPIPLAALGDPVAVKRGATVVAEFSEAGLSISATLVALQDGTAGDIIAVRNATTGIVVRAMVRAGGTVEVVE